MTIQQLQSNYQVIAIRVVNICPLELFRAIRHSGHFSRIVWQCRGHIAQTTVNKQHTHTHTDTHEQLSHRKPQKAAKKKQQQQQETLHIAARTRVPLTAVPICQRAVQRPPPQLSPGGQSSSSSASSALPVARADDRPGGGGAAVAPVRRLGARVAASHAVARASERGPARPRRHLAQRRLPQPGGELRQKRPAVQPPRQLQTQPGQAGRQEVAAQQQRQVPLPVQAEVVPHAPQRAALRSSSVLPNRSQRIFIRLKKMTQISV